MSIDSRGGDGPPELHAANPLASLLLRTALTEPGRPFLDADDGTVWTHGDVGVLSARVATLLRRHVRPGDRVAVQTAKTPWALVVHLACVRAGAVHVPMNPDYTDDETAWLLGDAEPALFIGDRARAGGPPRWSLDDLPAMVNEVVDDGADGADVPRDLADPAAMLYTSGTTGRPKGAVLSQGNLLFHARTLVQAWGFTPDDVLLHVLPLFHTHGLFVAAHCVLTSGASMVFHRNFDAPAAVEALRRSTVFMGVPTHYTRLLAVPGLDAGAAAGVRLFVSGSAPLLVATHEEFKARTGATILERYGMSETGMLTSNPLVGDRRPGTVGPALPGVGVRVVGDTGQVEVTGPNVFAGYWRRPELTATEFTPDGWFVTGDLGRMSIDGYLEIVGRSKDLIISGGFNVYPKEVETVLDDLDDVVESAVVGVPHPDFGEAVVAVVVLAPGSPLDAAGLRALARERLAPYKVPKVVIVVTALPRNAMGKVQKNVLRSQVAQA